MPELEWVEFEAEGFSNTVPGVIHRGTNPPVCGMPLGSLDTGCLDLEATGLWGYNSIFNSLMPRRAALLPFLGMSISGVRPQAEGFPGNPRYISNRVWMMTTLNMRWRDNDVWKRQLAMRDYYGICPAREIHYWGHYPVADLEFITDAPVGVGLRAWAPFLPGDTAASNTPGAVFEVHLRNLTDELQKGTLAFSFPGPSEGEAGTTQFVRQEVQGHCFNGVSVESEQAGYALGVVGEWPRTGGELGMSAEGWEEIEDELPYALSQAGASVAIDFQLAPEEEKVIRFLLAWHAPVWKGSGAMTSEGTDYTHMYACRYKGAVEVAQYLAHEHESLLKRILAWQEVIYKESDMPSWLRDSLVNILHLNAENSMWAQAKPPIGKWCRPGDGLFGMNDAPRWCAQVGTTPDTFYATIPLVYFFPDAALSMMRGFKAYMNDDGRASWLFGPKPCNMSPPVHERFETPQTELNGPCYVTMVDRLWQRTGDKKILEEFYESVKKNTIFTMNLVPGPGGVGIVSMTEGNSDWYEYCDLPGVVPHVGGIHLAHLRMARRMAEAMGDHEFVGQCDQWLRDGSQALEKYGWAGNYYLLFNDLKSGKKTDVVLGHQLDGEWMALSHGLEGVFRSERVEATLETLKKTSVAMTESGAVIFCKPDASPFGEGDWDTGWWGGHAVHPPGVNMLSMVYIYRGERDFGLDLTRRVTKEILERGWCWDQPNTLDTAMLPRGGCDYNQNMMLWALPAALAGEDLAGPCRGNGLVDRIIKAANPTG